MDDQGEESRAVEKMHQDQIPPAEIAKHSAVIVA
jgi:hypothetical protein